MAAGDSREEGKHKVTVKHIQGSCISTPDQFAFKAISIEQGEHQQVRS